MVELTAEEKSVLSQTYGQKVGAENSYSADKIEDVVELTADEKRFFDQKNFVSPFFSVQTLYKISGNISPIKFNRAVLSLIAEDKTFRTNYCNVGKRTLKIIFSEHSGTRSNALPEIVYRNLSNLEGEELDDTLTKIMEADRRKNFNLVNDHLFRFSVLRTGNEECAILFTALKLIADNFNEVNFFESLANNSTYQKAESKEITLDTAIIEKSVHDYWAKILKDLPPIKNLPYLKKSVKKYREKTFRAKIPADISSDLRVKAQSNKAMLMAILQTAWGFLLQSAENISDVTFCQIIATVTGGNSSLNIIPVRLQSAKDTSVEKIVAAQFKQSVVSRPYSFFDWDSLRNITGSSGQNFDHFLSFLDFQTNQKSYSEEKATPSGTVIAKNSWDSQGMRLGVYFQYSNTNLAVTFLYDANSFMMSADERLAKIYNIILRQMLLYWNAPFKDFIDSTTSKIVAEFDNKNVNLQDDKHIIHDFAVTHPLLQGTLKGIWRDVTEGAQLIRLFEGDRVHADLLESNLIFVVEGKLSRSLDTGDGWFNALDIISKGGWLNETVLLDKKRAVISLEVLTDQATLLAVPLENLNQVMKNSPEVVETFMTYILRQMEKYQILWLQS